MNAPRIRPKIVLRLNVINQSERVPGIPLNLIVLHSTDSHNYEGRRDLKAIGEWFDTPRAKSSSHVCTDADGTSARYVPDAKKAWTCQDYNSASLNVEQIGFSTQASWLDREVRETARWVAQWSIQHQIPIRQAEVSNGRVTRSGVIRHSTLGDDGGNHDDPGPGYPFRALLGWAKVYKGLRLGR